MASTLRFDNWENSNGDLIGTAANGYLGVPGTVLQVVSTTKTDTFSMSSSTFADITGMSASITPRSTSSKILVLVTLATESSNNNYIRVNLLRDGSNIAQPASGTEGASFGTDTDVNLGVPATSFVYLDSPASSSALTYKLQIAITSNTVYVNRSAGSANRTAISTITLMEIAG